MLKRYLVVAGALAAVALLTAQPSASRAEGADDTLDPKVEAARAVSEALYERGRHLFVRKDFANAKKMFVESLLRDSRGPKATDALAMLRSANEKLGIKDLEHGKPGVTTTTTTGKAPTDPVDPYATGKTGKPTGPVDPYNTDPGTGNIGTSDGPRDPYSSTLNRRSTAPAAPVDIARKSRRQVMMFSGLYGAALGLAIAGPIDDSTGEAGGGAFVGAVLGAGAGVAASYYLTKKRKLTLGQSYAIMSGGTWGGLMIGFFGDVVSGVDTSTTNDIYKSVAIGGALGLGGGILFAKKVNPTENQMAVINSGGLYGGGAALMLAVTMSPAESEGYSINGIVGSLAGLGVGYLASKKLDISRKRMLRIDLGAAAGVAATWALLYPLMEDPDSNNDEQTAGLLSIGAMAGGVAIAYYMTRKMDAKKSTSVRDVAATQVPLPGLITRTSNGWGLGAPVPRPMENPALAPRSGGFSLGADVLSARW